MILPVDLSFLFDYLQHLREDVARVAHYGYVDLYVLAYRCWIDVDVYDPGMRREFIRLARGPVVEPCSHGDDKVRFGDGHVCRVGPVHAEHAEKERMVPRDAAEAHEGVRDRYGQRFGEPGQFLRGIGQDDASAGIEDGSFRVEDKAHRLLYLSRVAHVGGLIAADDRLLGILEIADRRGHILGNVDENGSRSSRRRDMEGLLDDTGEVFHVPDEVAVLRAGPGDTHDVGLLKGVVADEHRVDLAGEDDEGDRIHVCRGYTRHRVRGAGPARHEGDTHPARCPRVPVGCVDGGLLMADDDLIDLAYVCQGICDVERSPSRIAEYRVDPFRLQGFDEDLCARSLQCFSFRCSELARLSMRSL
ncbi:MAG: hypothetical protein A4E61_01271 [Syntrophorhabdus sp. PtaB.Bin184]|nr:MAG: hypothetical protein A4E61_01271 [Syntrophorhabdus sp. PtaB.Bin184]